jgi:hypothetical protein
LQSSKFWITCGAAIMAAVTVIGTDADSSVKASSIAGAVAVVGLYFFQRHQQEMQSQAHAQSMTTSQACGDFPSVLPILAAVLFFFCSGSADAQHVSVYGPRWRVYVAPVVVTPAPVVVPVAPPVVVIPAVPVAPVVVVRSPYIVVDPYRPAYPARSIYMSPATTPGAKPVYYQIVPLLLR